MKDTFYKNLLDNLYDGVYFVDPNRTITYWNKGAERITGFKSEEVVGRRCMDEILVHVDTAGTRLCHGDCPLKCSIADKKERENEVFLHHKLGHRVPVVVKTSPLVDEDGVVIGGLEIFSDNTRMFDAKSQLSKAEIESMTDSLTGLYNRRYIDHKMNTFFSTIPDKPNEAIMFLDIDHFKVVNDTYGHAAGDQVLKTLANTLKHNTRANDIVGRWGGEEFLILLPEINPAYLQTVAQKLRMLVEATKIKWENQEIRVTISIGATSVLPNDTSAELIQRADDLMYQSKTNGRNRVTVG